MSDSSVPSKASRTAPKSWSASDSARRHQGLDKESAAASSATGRADGDQQQEESGGMGPALPFRVKTTYLWPMQLGRQPTYTLHIPIDSTGNKANIYNWV
mmetsp:Transcript_37299/g.84228  ORF Transcript_37299/g.84228 Transcript_37299/m.84228 type:complete len:100 (-) Transcript_37299:22-321(-)